MSLILLIVLATISYTLFDIFASRAGNHIDPNLSSVIFNGIGAVLPLAIYLLIRSAKSSHVTPPSSSGVLFSVLAGVSIAIFSILLIRIFEKGGLSYVIPLIYGGTVILSALVGWLMFRETVTLMGVAGIILATVGIGLVAFSR